LIVGVEPICDVLQFAPSTYYAFKARPPSARALSDALMKVVLLKLFIDNLSVYGARKLWVAAQRAGHDIGRDQVARLMGDLNIQGARRQRHVRTTRRTEGAPRAPDLVDRDFTAVTPDLLWVTDLTHVQTWAGTAYVSFITDVFSRFIDVGDGTDPAGWPSFRRAGLPFRCRVTIHVDPLHRTPRRTRGGTVDRFGGGLL